ncbi:alpha-1,3-mannosyl-glycoprotein 4-beta-N-acetylglucosaminyltransferase-like protein MGAT4E isoform X2 [Sturnira hondurensis]|uniref:alpha-1,3-mannosyl-glycoprotein 4-beta-N-acetylglucosaminyltransferase-like protein MGAT4E isoform X2 n=1 Tax=Sturnira hondurensis TaxID=192404 RepID=UPI001879A498|nr:alpha-1,3-mannosyl-glycoprotein 4-beta-N-acetylglucosaminyltransferase-like protein MGAT4E isoform X2 [Sturnira hondurensis]
MRGSIRHGLLTSVALGLLWLFITLKVSSKIEEDPVMSIKGQDSGGRRQDPRPREDWQNLTFQYMKKVQQRRKIWLMVGISSGPGPDRRGLLHTLVSLFRASSRAEQRRLTVLVHLAHSDPASLRKTTAQISTLFSPQILAGQLVLIHAPPDAYPVGDPGDAADQGDACSKQNVDHAFLVSFAAGLSDYFLLLEDDAVCAPDFLTHIRWRVGNRSRTPWVLLELSNLGLLGKLLRGRDLPLLARFLLLFHQEKPLVQLLPHFRTLLAQRQAILSTPFLFYRRGPHYSAHGSRAAGALRNRGPRGPHNPPGAVFTDMKVWGVHFPWQAYALDESFFWTHNVSAGSHLTVILNHPASLRRVQVLTGTIVDGKHALQKGRVELGYEPEGMPQYCTSFAVLGPLLEGQLDQETVPQSMGHDVSCVRLVVSAHQAGGLIVRHIHLWEEQAKGRTAAPSGR